MTNIKRFLPWLLVPVLGLGAYFWLRSPKASAGGEPIYRTSRVTRGDVVQTVSASGPLSAVATVEVGSQVSGNIAKLYVDFNDAVKQGQLIAEIEPSTYEAKVVQAESDLASAEATLEVKRLTAKRTAELFAKKLVSDSDNDTAVAEYKQQEATVKKTRAALKSAQVDLDRCKIRSPINGVVISRSIDAGQTVQASFSAPTLFTLAQDLREMQITANVSEADIGGVSEGQQVSFVVDAFPSRTFTGTVKQVRNNPTTTNNVVNYYTIISVKNEDLKLRPGMTATATITTAKKSGVVSVPNGALRFKAPENARLAQQTAAGASAPSSAEPASSEEPPMPDLERMPAEIRQRILADFDKNGDGKIDGDEATALRERMKARFAAGGGPGARPGAGQQRSAGAAVSTSKTVYVLDGTPDASGRATGMLTPKRVTIGITDTTRTEIVSGLSEGELVVTGTTSAAVDSSTQSQAASNPFAPKPPPAPSNSKR